MLRTGTSVWPQVCPASCCPLGVYVKVTYSSPGALASLTLTFSG